MDSRFNYSRLSQIFIFLIICLSVSITPSKGNTQYNGVTVIDSWHYSQVFGEVRNFRIILPPGYFENSNKRFPVIYYYHGWSQRYFGSTRGAEYPDEDSLNVDNIVSFVATHDVIVVRPDGYDRRPDEEYALRPYNIGIRGRMTYRQFPIYFPELVDYIDKNYRTIPDREHRAISGLSMGGFMTWWLSGKYPDMICAAGNFCGSTEFSAGPADFPVEYRHLDMYNNYGGVKVRLHYGDEDFIRFYHEDVNRVWTNVMDNYEYKIYKGVHQSLGLTDMFNFIMKTFESPLKKPDKWNHIDIYPAFKIWGYEVNTDRNIPGYTILEKVNSHGFRCSVREFLPDGSLIPHVKVSILTPPDYKKDSQYMITDYDIGRMKKDQKIINSDKEGRLRINLNGGLHEIGINDPDKNMPNICLSSFSVEKTGHAISGLEATLSVNLLNKGLAKANDIKAYIEALKKDGVDISKNEVEFGSIDVNKIANGKSEFSFTVTSEVIDIVKFRLIIRDDKSNEWSESIIIPVEKNSPLNKDFLIADGRTIKIFENADDTTTVVIGHGNGDGIVNPGEHIVVLIKDGIAYRRAEIFTSDQYVNPFGINIRESDYWGSYDHVGASAKYSVPLISSNTPENHKIEMFYNIQVPVKRPEHYFKYGKISVPVKGKDNTSPLLSWLKVTGDNTVQAKLYDGAKITTVKARFKSVKYPGKDFEIVLLDDGKNWDLVENDLVFSNRITPSNFNSYTIEIEAMDVYGNMLTNKSEKVFYLH